ncbi:hypothetical protein BDM02DRAFT_3113105 [Thelephora ganbajun]|uniref:Uncharacterized protein n=1 Tax=Thelephora ganbajun TaxID=370292 RepID=A0ACB6ZJS7_THEGA|nr:hypothetical protein BDM02DRAFT_3113105 [Thelephora ganbajun]
MDAFDDIQKYMLGKEWLAKVDNETSTPYLLKFHASESELACSLMITDTKSIWFETLMSNQLARRWRECHPLKSKSNLTSREEELWRRDILKCLSAAHTIGNFAEMSFEIVKSLYSDLAFELHLEDFVFRWETNWAGPRISAEVISRQIIMPLMSTAHLAFSSPNSVGEISESDLETAIDKLGRAARRTPGMHIRNAISKPRLATSIRRMTAMLNFLVELPNIQLGIEKMNVNSSDLTPGTATSEIRIMEHSSPIPDVEMGDPAVLNSQDKDMRDWLEPAETKSQGQSLATPRAGPSNTKSDDDSATENSDDEEHLILGKPAPPTGPPITRSPASVDKKKAIHSKPVPQEVQIPPKKSVASNPPPSPAGPSAPKKAKRDASSSSDPDESDRVVAGPSTRRGARQPIKRGGRRF